MFFLPKVLDTPRLGVHYETAVWLCEKCGTLLRKSNKSNLQASLKRKQAPSVWAKDRSFVEIDQSNMNAASKFMDWSFRFSYEN